VPLPEAARMVVCGPSTPSVRIALGTIRDVERAHIRAVLQRCGGVIEGASGAAAILGLAPSTLRFRIRKLGIARDACPRSEPQRDWPQSSRAMNRKALNLVSPAAAA